MLLPVVDSVNAGRHPAYREAVLDRTLHTFTCDACSFSLFVDKSLSYLDIERRQFLGVYAQSDVRNANEIANAFDDTFRLWMKEEAPAFMADVSDEFLVRVCFGYEELREKLVCADAGLHDLIVEAVKCDTMLGSEELHSPGVLTLRLDHVDSRDLHFLVERIAQPFTPMLCRVARSAYDQWSERREDILEFFPDIAYACHVSMLRAALPAAVA
jgi:hypothetical protein